jgi:hypothetical protein
VSQGFGSQLGFTPIIGIGPGAGPPEEVRLRNQLINFLIFNSLLKNYLFLSVDAFKVWPQISSPSSRPGMTKPLIRYFQATTDG